MKKELILQKALHLFANEGYEGIGVARIVKEVGVTKPTLYHYFGSKEGLLISIYETYFDEVIKIYQSGLPFKQDIMGTISKVMEAYFYFVKTHRNFFWLMNHLRKGPLNSTSRKVVEPYHEREYNRVLELMQEISHFHTNMKGLEDVLVINFLSLLNGFMEVKLAKNTIEEVSSDDLHKLMKQFLYGIFSL